MVNINFFYRLIVLELDSTNKVMQNPPLKFRQSSFSSEKPGYFSGTF